MIVPLSVILFLKKAWLSYQFSDKTLRNEIKNRPTIYFDISVYVHSKNFTGIQRVVYNFVKYLPEQCKDYYDVKYISASNKYYQVEYVNGNWVEISEVNPTKGDIYLAIDLVAIEQLLHRKQLRDWQRKGCFFINCVHDITFLKYPQFISYDYFCKVLKVWFKFITHNYDGIISVSETVKNEIIDVVKTDIKAKDSIQYGYFHNGVDFSRSGSGKRVNDETVFIAVSTIEPRKGYDELIEAFEKAELINPCIKLIIVGREGWKCSETINKMKNSRLYGDRLRWYSNCDDDQLQELYYEADFFVSASYYEGFGIGLVEAASFGLPVLVRDIPVYREVTKGKGVFFKDKDDLVDKILYCSNNKDDLKSCIIDYLTWEESVEMAYSEIRRMHEYDLTRE